MGFKSLAQTRPTAKCRLARTLGLTQRLQRTVQSWAAFLTAVAVAIAIAQLWDRHYVTTKTSNRARESLIRFYVYLDARTSPVPKEEMKEWVMLPIRAILPGLLFYGAIFALAKLIGDTLFYVLLVVGLGLAIPLAVMLLAISVLTFIGIARIAYGISRFVLVHILDRMSDPKNSPFTYVLSMLAIFAAVAKAAIEVVKLVSPP